MDKKKSRDPKDTLAFLKEWVSDNLRYILLAAAIIIIVLIIIFAVSSSPIKSPDRSADSQSSTVIETSTANTANENGIATEDKTNSLTEAVKAEEKSSSTDESSAQTEEGSASTGTSSQTEERSGDADALTNEASVAESTETAQAETAQAETQPGSQLTVADPEISSTVETYLTALAAGDVNSAASVCENLTEAEVAAITSGAYPSPMEHIVVYAYPGTEAGSYVAVVRFDATDRTTLVSMPACSAYYLITADTGAVLMASADTTAAHQAEIDQVLGYPAVAQLIADVSNAAQAVVSATTATAQ